MNRNQTLSFPHFRKSQPGPMIMGIINVTPDSFSDGGLYDSVEAAIAHGEKLMAEGADILDIGGESTRPGSIRISSSEEIERIGDVVTELLAKGATISVDTLHAETAAQMAQRGAQIINDVSGGCYDPQMGAAVAESNAAFICQHWRGTPDVMDTMTDYPNGVVAGVIEELSTQIASLIEAGIDEKRIIIDPGLGFAKTAEQSWELLQKSEDIACELNRPILIGHSRKRFLAQACPEDQWLQMRDIATNAVSALCTSKEIWGIRVHDVKTNVTAVKSALCWKSKN